MVIYKYVSSDGEEIDTTTIDKNHLVNALVKSSKDCCLYGQGSEKRLKALSNVEVLKEELLRRIK